VAFVERAKGTDVALGDADQQRLVAREPPSYLTCRVTWPEKFHPPRLEASPPGDGWCGWGSARIARVIGSASIRLPAAFAAPDYFRMLTARATISATVTMDTVDCRVMASLAQRDSGITSVGLNAAALVKARYR